MLLDKDVASGCPLSDHLPREPIAILDPTLRPSSHGPTSPRSSFSAHRTLCYYFTFSPEREFLLFCLKNEDRSSGKQAVRHHVRGSSPLPRLTRWQGPAPCQKTPSSFIKGSSWGDGQATWPKRKDGFRIMKMLLKSHEAIFPYFFYIELITFYWIIVDL